MASAPPVLGVWRTGLILTQAVPIGVRSGAPSPAHAISRMSLAPSPEMSSPMFRRLLKAGIIAVALTTFTAVPASAADSTTPLSLVKYTAVVSAPPVQTPPQEMWPACDMGSKLWCGAVTIDATFAGLEGRSRPGWGPGAPSVNLAGTVEVTRTYGCTNPAGKLVHHFDRTVQASESLNTRRGHGDQFPDTGDTMTVRTYAFLSDRQPFNCPKGLTPVTTSIVATSATLKLDSYFRPIPSGSYTVPLSVSWHGIASTPPAPRSPIGV